jgi:hypothetical protein
MGANKGVPKSEAHKRAIGDALRGRHHTKAARRNISVGLRRHFDARNERTA